MVFSSPDTTDALADVLPGIQLFGSGTHIARAVALAAGVSGLHDPSAPGAPQQALQQRSPFPDRATGLVTRTAPITAQPGGVGLVVVPGDEARVVLGDQNLPLIARHDPVSGQDLPGVGIHTLFGAGATEDEGPGIGRVGQEVVHRRVTSISPGDARGTGTAARQQQMILAQADQHLAGRAKLVEAAEDGDDHLSHRLVGGDDHLVVLVVVQPDRQALAQFAPPGLVLKPGGQSRADEMQLGLRHGALKPQNETIVEVGGVIDPVSVGDQGVGQRAQIQQLIPVGVVAGQAGNLDAQHQPDLAQPDVGDQLLETEPTCALGAGAAQVRVDDHDLVPWPAQRHRAFAQFVLSGQRLSVMDHL